MIFFQLLILALFLYIIYLYKNKKSRHGHKKNIVLSSLHEDNSWIPVIPKGDDTDKLVHEEDIEKLASYGSFWIEIDRSTPSFFIADPMVLKKILVTNFSKFHSRDDRTSGDAFLGLMLNSLHGEKWKKTRSLISPTFTTGKLKLIRDEIKDITRNLIDDIRTRCSDGDTSTTINVNNYFSAFTSDLIARVAFGLKINSFKDPTNEFLRHVQRLSTSQSLEKGSFFKKIFGKFSSSSSSNSDSVQFFKDLIQKVIWERIQLRNQERSKPNDFIDILAQAFSNLPNHPGLNNDTLLAQAVLFIFAAHDTSRITLSMLCHNLAKSPEKQTLLKREIFQNDGNSVYLNACIKETLRLYSPLVRLRRKCQENFSEDISENKSINIPKGAMVYIPIWAIHKNPEFYEKPKEFIPERFIGDGGEMKLEEPFTYLPFGDGPRHCLGLRFAQEQIEIALVEILRNFHIELTSGKDELVEFLPNMQFNIEFKNHVLLKFCRIDL